MRFSFISPATLLRFLVPSALVALPLVGNFACSAPPADDGGDLNPDNGDGSGGTAEDDFGDDSPVDGSGSGGGGNKPPAELFETLPPGFTANEFGYPAGQPGKGGFKIVGTLADYTGGDQNSCKNVLTTVIRDFQPYCKPLGANGDANECANGDSAQMLAGGHIDFGRQKPTNWVAPGLYPNMVSTTLGDDSKPVAAGAATGNADRLDTWFNEKAGSADYDMESYVMEIWLEPETEGSKTFIYDANDYFPIDTPPAGSGLFDPNAHPLNDNYGGENNSKKHNFGFTTEIHTAFEYKGGEVFDFRGDDDVWIFIDKKLVVDLGGIHGAQPGSVLLDNLGLEIGKVYQLDMFQAERHPGGSNFRISTSLDFQSCGIIPGGVN
ncbi:MAG TPA: fibro-slime domain-containing protein [Polyangiaceae bacterium]|nr:fibro-slime domain-containing protein [Polyangiaceae bacterium]